MKGRGPATQFPSLMPAAQLAFEYDGNGFAALGAASSIGVGRTGIATPACGSPCYWTSEYYSALPAFAKTWTEKTDRVALFVVRAKGGAALTTQGDSGNGYWLDFTNSTVCTNSRDPAQCRALYRTALTDFVEAYAHANERWSVQGLFALWVQGENDAAFGVSSASYQAGLANLVTTLDRDLLAATQRTLSGFLLAETGYFANSTAYSATPDTVAIHRNKVNAITGAQKLAGSTSKIVLASNAARKFMSPCFNSSPGQTAGLSPDCGSFDLIHYSTPAYERLGVELATHGATFADTGVKPLDPVSCHSRPELCAASVEVYRWAGTAGRVNHATSSDPGEFDGDASYAFKGVRFHLFSETATGRVPLYRKYHPSLDHFMESTTASGDAGYGSNVLLGYCYASPSANASVALKRLKLTDGTGTILNRVTSQDPVEIELLLDRGYASEGVLCYTS
ncbi:MAG: hypothetical protein NDJ90_09110 [Oligoflexia bacterium]|nr:hypothetical protein [Oligoflexia bacterium]